MSNILPLLSVLLSLLIIFGCGGGGGGNTTKNFGNNSNYDNFGGENGDNGSFGNFDNDDNISPQIRKFLAIYMVGSDLESRDGLATKDLLELINGYKALSEEEKEKVYIYVAFGGADKEGWRGIKYADIQCLIQDSSNNIFGDDNCYEYQQLINPQNLKDMGDEEALEHFLFSVKEKSQNFDRKILIMWNHGGAFSGYGLDENWKNDKLELPEIKKAFSNANLYFDIIGFDACLMANLETATVLKDNGKYLVASEESEPGHGWDYNKVVKAISKNDNILDISKKLVDYYVYNPKHYKGRGLTLSVIDLSKIDGVIQEIENSIKNGSFYSIYLSDFVNAEVSTEKFGFNINEKLEISYSSEDAIEYFNILGLDSVKQKLQEAVVYSKTDGTRDANGISFVSVLNGIEKLKNGEYKSKNSFSIDYYNFIVDIKNTISEDTEKPTITYLGSCNYSSKTGDCYHIIDEETAVSDVLVFSFLCSDYNDKCYLTTADTPLKISSNKYFINLSDYNYVLEICNGSCLNIESQRVALPLYYLYKTVDGTYFYIAFVHAILKNTYNMDGFFILKYNPENNFFDYYISNSPTSKTGYKLGKEITSITFRYFYIDGYGNTGFENGYTISFSPQENVDFYLHKANLKHILLTSDLNGNINFLYLN